MNILTTWRALQALLALFVLCCGGCATTESTQDPFEGESPFAVTELPFREEAIAEEKETASFEEGEVSLGVVEIQQHEKVSSLEVLEEIVVSVPPKRPHEVIRDRLYEARELLSQVELDYVFVKQRGKDVLRGRPIAFALWSERSREWAIAYLEIPIPAPLWRPGGKPIVFRMLTDGIVATHDRGVGAERLMFTFSREGEELKVYGRKFPVFDSALLAKKKWREVAWTAKPITYLPFTEDTLDPSFVVGGKDFLLATARQAITELRAARVPSLGYPGSFLADITTAEVIATLAVIEQMDDAQYIKDSTTAIEEILNHYGLKKEEAYRFSVSRASAIGPMQFTNSKGNGTYAMVVRRCPLARIDPNFERGATDILNVMKAAICLFDIEVSQMRKEIRLAYRQSVEVLGIFPVAAYNGGPRNVTKLYAVVRKMGVKLEDLRALPEGPQEYKVACPCLWRETKQGIRPLAIPKYNNENRWYVEKYQSILNVFDDS